MDVIQKRTGVKYHEVHIYRLLHKWGFVQKMPQKRFVRTASKEEKKKFKKFVIFVDRAPQHRSNIVKKYLKRNKDNIRIEYLPVGSPEFNAVEECWRQGKYEILSHYHSSFFQLKQIISRYYRTTRFNLDIKKYLLRYTN